MGEGAANRTLKAKNYSSTTNCLSTRNMSDAESPGYLKIPIDFTALLMLDVFPHQQAFVSLVLGL